MGPAPARNAVLTAYTKSLTQFKARQLCHMSGFNRSDHEDLVQELTLRLLEKAHLYDPRRRASIDTFADRVVNSAVRMILRERRRKKRSAGLTALSLDSEITDQDRRPTTMANLVSENDQARRTGAPTRDPHELAEITEAVARAKQSLTPPDATIAACEFGTVSSVGRALIVSRRQVYAALGRMREPFEDAGLGDG